MSSEMSEENTRMGNCLFCGQTRIIELPLEDLLDRIKKTGKAAEDIADYEASRECKCKEGSAWREDQRVQEDCEQNIEEMFRDDYPEIAEIFQGVKGIIWRKRLKKISIATNEGGNASMYRKEGCIEIKFTQKNEKKLTASI